MSRSNLCTVRFSPAPEVGEWLNIAVIGSNQAERRAGVALGESARRVAAAFGDEAAGRAARLCLDLPRFAERLQTRLASPSDEAIPTVADALKDRALSVSVSKEFVVFEGGFDEAMREASRRYLGSAPMGAESEGKSPDPRPEASRGSFHRKLVDLYEGRELPVELEAELEAAALNDSDLAVEMATLRGAVDFIRNQASPFNEESYQRIRQILMLLADRFEEASPETPRLQYELPIQ